MIALSTTSYAAIGVVYVLLTIMLVTSWRGHRVGAFLIAASVASVVWASILALHSSNPQSGMRLIFLAEVFRSAAWITFLVVLVAQIGVARAIRYGSLAVWVVVLIAGVRLFVSDPDFVESEKLSDVMIPGGLAMALVGLMLIEQLYRNSPREARWGLKMLVLGVGGIFAYDLFLYSQAMLFGVFDSSTWTARGAVNILFVPLIALAARRNPTWDLDVFVSRQVVFFSTTLIAVGLYLVLMGLGGYALVLLGGSWGAVAQVVFLVGALLVLLILLFSGTLRARLRVFLSKHFFSNKYDHREEWLRLVSTLAEFEASSTREIVIKAMVQIVDSSSGFLWIREEGDSRYRVAASYKTSRQLPDVSADSPLVRFMAREFWLIDLDEFNAEPDRYGNLELPDWLLEDPEAWLIVPLAARDHLIGFILVDRGVVGYKMNYEDRDLLKTVGSHIAVHLAQEKSDSMLAEARQFEAYNRLTAFLMHDLNNLIAQQSLIVENAETHKRNPDFVDDALKTVANSVERMKKVMRQLQRRGNDRTKGKIDVGELVEEAVTQCSERQPAPQLNSGPVNCRLDADRDRFTMVLVHLIKNAQDATPDDGKVEIDATHSDGRLQIAIADTGSGMTRDFIRDRLFRPFDSTKGSQGMGIGAYQAREFVRGLGGELFVESVVNQGTTVSISLPTSPTD
jgi:putative PEP-CTERM system histidine kinase